MKTPSMIVALATLLVSTLLAAAEPPKDSPAFILATYYTCTGKIALADKAFDGLIKGELEMLVKENKAASFGYLTKGRGGEFTRAIFLTGTSPINVLNSAANLTAYSDSKPPKQTYDEICGFGQDYVWHVVVGTDPTSSRGPIAFSTYYICDQTREAEVDALAKRVVAPTLDKLLKDGKLKSWFWAEHIFGGKYRRLLTMSAPNQDALLQARDEFQDASERDPLASSLKAICGSHDDYIWNDGLVAH